MINPKNLRSLIAKKDGSPVALALNTVPRNRYEVPKELTVGLELELPFWRLDASAPLAPDFDAEAVFRHLTGDQFSREVMANVLEVKNLKPSSNIPGVIAELRGHLRQAHEVLRTQRFHFVPTGVSPFFFQNRLAPDPFLERIAQETHGLPSMLLDSTCSTQINVGDLGCGDAALFLHRALGRVGVLFTALTANSALIGSMDSQMLSARTNLRGLTLNGGALAEILPPGETFEQYIRRHDQHCGHGGYEGFRRTFFGHNRPLRLRPDRGTHCIEFGFCDLIPTLERTQAITEFLVALMRTILERCYAGGEELPSCFPEEFNHANLASNSQAAAKLGLNAPFVSPAGACTAFDTLYRLMDWVGAGHSLLAPATPAEETRDRFRAICPTFGAIDLHAAIEAVRPLATELEGELSFGSSPRCF